MKWLKNLIVLQVFMACSITEVQAFEKDSTKQGFIEYFLFPDSTQYFRVKFAPILKLSPETSLGFGATVILNWDFKNVDPGTFGSMGRTTFYYTLNQQYDWTTYFEIFTNRNDYFFVGSISYNRFPQYFYGIGNFIEASDREELNYQRVYLDLKGRRRIFRKIYLGAAYYLNKLYNVSWTEGESSRFWKNPTLVGTNGYFVSGLGPDVTYDSRDLASNPSKGSFISLTYLIFGRLTGSEQTYQGLEFRASKYLKVSREHFWILGINFYGNFAWGSIPFDRIPGLGNDKIMRGYYNGRFRENNYMTVQAEWRMPIWKIIGAVAWVGTGQVGSNFSAFTLDGLKPNFGMGIRVMFDKSSKSNIRYDQGFGNGESGGYLSIGEAF
jgi:outer membrane protein assembly factor BamA